VKWPQHASSLSCATVVACAARFVKQRPGFH